MTDKLCNNLNALAFVKQFKDDSAHIAATLDLPVENILGLAAEESLYGKGRIATEYNNYFSMHAPAPGQIGDAPALGSKKVRVAKYASFADCARSFAMRFGPNVRGKIDPTEFANALVKAGYNTADSQTGGRDDFVEYLVGIIGAVKGRMGCK